jgi:hypothetical protein
MPDQRAVKTLLGTYWTSAGWRGDEDRHIEPAEFEHAKRAGIMFDEARVTHADVIERLIRARDALDRPTVARAFVASLGNRRLDLRSALGSYAVFRHLQPHDESAGKICGGCGLWEASSEPEDLNVLNFERFKWGGVRHDQPLYAMLDLELFLKEEVPRPTKQDVEVLRAIFAALREAPAGTTGAQAHRVLPKSFKANKAERDVMIAILGFCSILATDEYPGYAETFVSPSSTRRFNEMSYPACCWRAADGLSAKAISDYFGEFS